MVRLSEAGVSFQLKKIDKTGIDIIIICYAKMRCELSVDTAEGAHD